MGSPVTTSLKNQRRALAHLPQFPPHRRRAKRFLTNPGGADEAMDQRGHMPARVIQAKDLSEAPTYTGSLMTGCERGCVARTTH